MEQLIEKFKLLPEREQILLLMKLWKISEGGQSDSFKAESSGDSNSSKGQTDTRTGQPACDCER